MTGMQFLVCPAGQVSMMCTVFRPGFQANDPAASELPLPVLLILVAWQGGFGAWLRRLPRPVNL